MTIPIGLRARVLPDGFRGFFLESRRGFRASGVVEKDSVIRILRALAKRGGNYGRTERYPPRGWAASNEVAIRLLERATGVRFLIFAESF
jgi:hypothetical protein